MTFPSRDVHELVHTGQTTAHATNTIENPFTQPVWLTRRQPNPATCSRLPPRPLEHRSGLWTRINPDDPDTWPRPGNLVLVANDFGANLNLRSFRYETGGSDTYINAYDEHGDYDDGMEKPEELLVMPQ